MRCSARGLGYGLLAVYAGTIYVLVVALGGDILVPLLPPWWLNLIAVLTIAATFLPVHNWLRACVDRLVYDWHDNPYVVLSEVRQHLDYEQSQAPQPIVGTIAATIAATLRLPYVAIETELGDGVQMTTYGTPPPRAKLLIVPLAYSGTAIGAFARGGAPPGRVALGERPAGAARSGPAGRDHAARCPALRGAPGLARAVGHGPRGGAAAHPP